MISYRFDCIGYDNVVLLVITVLTIFVEVIKSSAVIVMLVIYFHLNKYHIVK